MELKAFLTRMEVAERERFARKAGTTYAYLIQLMGGHRKPSPGLAKKLVRASDEEITLESLRPDIWGSV